MNILLTVLIVISQTLTEYFVIEKITYENKKYSNYNKIICFIIFLIHMILSNYIVPNHLRLIFSIIVYVFVISFVLKFKIMYAIVNSFISMAFISITEIIIIFILFIIGLSQQEFLNNMYLEFILNFLISFISIVLINIPPLLKVILKTKNKIIKRKNLLKSCIVIIVIIYLIIAKNALYATTKLDMFINLSILFITVGLFIIIFVSDNKNNLLEEINKQMITHVTKYEKIVTEQGKANHEFKNQLMVIRGYALANNNDKLVEYINNTIKESTNTHSSYFISQLNKFPDGGIKGLLYYKLSIMDDKNIKCQIDVEHGVKTKLKNLKLTMYNNITKILGVLLDNAIDASVKSKNKEIIILVTKQKDIVSFSISNTYKGIINKNKIGTGYTSKGFNHGYGLRLVNDIIRENYRLKIKNSISDTYYSTTLIIEIKNNK